MAPAPQCELNALGKQQWQVWPKTHPHSSLGTKIFDYFSSSTAELGKRFKTAILRPTCCLQIHHTAYSREKLNFHFPSSRFNTEWKYNIHSRICLSCFCWSFQERTSLHLHFDLRTAPAPGKAVIRRCLLRNRDVCKSNFPQSTLALFFVQPGKSWGP
jgi:hypothetical protein